VPRWEWKEEIAIGHPRYITFPHRWAFSWVWAFYLKALWADALPPFDLLHAHVLYPDGMAAVTLGKLFERPVVITAHGSDVNLYPRERQLWRLLTVWTAEYADKVVTVSRALKMNLHGLGAWRADVVVVPDGVDGGRFFPRDKRSCASRLGLEASRRRVLYVGSLKESKGVGVLLEAFGRLKGLELVLVGPGEARRYPPRSGVRFVGPVPYEEVPFWMGASDLVVQPSFLEGFGMTVIEALSCGRPVVATRSGGPQDTVEEGVGVLVPPGDAEALAEAMEGVLAQLDRYRPEELHAYAQGRFGLERVAERLFGLYQEVLDGR